MIMYFRDIGPKLNTNTQRFPGPRSAMGPNCPQKQPAGGRTSHSRGWLRSARLCSKPLHNRLSTATQERICSQAHKSSAKCGPKQKQLLRAEKCSLRAEKCSLRAEKWVFGFCKIYIILLNPRKAVRNLTGLSLKSDKGLQI